MHHLRKPRGCGPQNISYNVSQGMAAGVMGGSTRGSVMLMGRRQAELSTSDHAFLHEPKSCLAPTAALTPWQTVTCTLWCQRRGPFCFLQVRVSQQIKEIMGRREEIPFFWFPTFLVISHTAQVSFALHPIKREQGCRRSCCFLSRAVTAWICQ